VYKKHVQANSNIHLDFLIAAGFKAKQKQPTLNPDMIARFLAPVETRALDLDVAESRNRYYARKRGSLQ